MVRYRYCSVPLCKNTLIKTPQKIFFHMPNDPARRKKWCSMMKRDLPSEKSKLFVCEDHFDIEKDMENYMRYRLQGGRTSIKKDSYPHIFHCQKPVKAPAPSTVRQIKREQKRVVQELLNAFASKSKPGLEPSAGEPSTPDNVVLLMDSSSTLQVEDNKKPRYSAIGCVDKSRSEQGYQMKIFPKDPKRRKLKISNVNRQNCEPTKNNFLRKVHFDEDQWEKCTDKCDRKIRILKDAVPSIFSHSPNGVRSPTLDCHTVVHEKVKLYNDLDKRKGNEQNSDPTVLSVVMDLEIEGDENPLLALLSNDLDIKIKNEDQPNLTTV